MEGFQFLGVGNQNRGCGSPFSCQPLCCQFDALGDRLVKIIERIILIIPSAKGVSGLGRVSRRGCFLAAQHLLRIHGTATVGAKGHIDFGTVLDIAEIARYVSIKGAAADIAKPGNVHYVALPRYITVNYRYIAADGH